MMAFSASQARQLKAKLAADHVKSRTENGATLSYIEGWHAISEANRIFGYDAWDRVTANSRCVWTGTSGRFYMAAYTAKVRISVRAGDIVIVREGSGSGESKALTPGQAHELALKSAETDATKRALATFGNPFGLALYDPQQSGVRQSRKSDAVDLPSSWTLRSANGEETARYEKPNEFVEALRNALSDAPDIEVLFALWEENVDEVRLLNRALRQEHLTKSGVAPQLVEHLKRCAVALATPHGDASDGDGTPSPKPANGKKQDKIDKSALTIAEPKRIRNKEHLRFVAGQPCLICGRTPAQAHHLRHAQSRGMSLKVSDEFTVPLCAIHHHALHRVGQEELWWRDQHVDPLPIARRLWQQSCSNSPAAMGADDGALDDTAAEPDRT
jgi:DNA recombination protein Rad52